MWEAQQLDSPWWQQEVPENRLDSTRTVVLVAPTPLNAESVFSIFNFATNLAVVSLCCQLLRCED